jgi:hypothetical protein
MRKGFDYKRVCVLVTMHRPVSDDTLVLNYASFKKELRKGERIVEKGNENVVLLVLVRPKEALKEPRRSVLAA